MKSQEYISLIRKTYEEIINDFQTSVDKDEFERLFVECAEILLENENSDYYEIFKAISEDYLKSVKAISKLSSGFATGLRDLKYGITLNTYEGKGSFILKDDSISEKTVFDASSITKMFTAILLLKEAEDGNIDLSKNFSDYSPLLSKIDVPIIEALRFGVNLRTDGRVDDGLISAEERIRRLLNVYIVSRDTFIYSDIPYMLVPLLFGNNLAEATENYLKKFYDFYRDKVGLEYTGYSTINMTGGKIKTYFDQENNRFIYTEDGVFDPKANIFEREIGYVSGHAGVTTNVCDLQKLFVCLSNGLLSEDSLKALVTTVQPESKVLLDKYGNPILDGDEPIYLKHAMGIYVNTGSVMISDVPARYSDNAFVAAGSTGTYSAFDLDNGLNVIYLSNVRSGLYSKIINTEDYVYGDDGDNFPLYYETTVTAGTGTLKDGQMLKEDGSFMPYSRVTNNFKEESLDTLFKLRLAKSVLIKRAKLECASEELRRIDEAFDCTTNIKKYYR